MSDPRAPVDVAAIGGGALVACRIGKVRMKAGATVVPIGAVERTEAARRLIDHASVIAGYETPDCRIVSTVVIAVFEDGTSASGMRHYPDAALPRWAMPHIVSELVRDGLIATPEATGIVNRALGFEGEQ